MMDCYPFLKPLLFALPPERAHHAVISLLSTFPQVATLYRIKNAPSLSLNCGRFTLRSPLAIAAGFDKDAQTLPFCQGWNVLGNLEVGTVTRFAQVGNPKPRIWRYPKTQSLRNALSFPGAGFDAVACRLKKLKPQPAFALGVNIGKMKDASPEAALDQYAWMIRQLGNLPRYITINLSSPNTPGLRDMQRMDTITQINRMAQEVQAAAPIFIKLSPDLDTEMLQKIVEACLDAPSIAGIVCSNTLPSEDMGLGGMSGKHIWQQARQARETIGQVLRSARQKNFIFVGVGGIASYTDLIHHWQQGGHWVQLYTALVYKGPGLLVKIYHDLLNDMAQKGITDLDELRGSYL